ncbi:MAG: TylF/MycF/NovP-related O-methyltransferase [Burkholderiaceae bacterium]
MLALISRLKQALLGQAPADTPMPDADQVAALIAKIRSDSLSYCGPPKLENIAEAIQRVREERVAGSYLEAGVALGGSAILIGQLKPRASVLRLYDVFGMIPPPTANDGQDAHDRFAEIASGQSAGLGGQTYYGYVDNLIDVVRANLERHGLDLRADNIELVPGLFEDTLSPDWPVALAHIDCDWYDSVKICIERLAQVMAPGGIMVFDDYSSYSGCNRAVDEFLAVAPDFERIFHRRSLGVRRRPSNGRPEGASVPGRSG